MSLKLIIGLGNPDKKYANTYHNVGILFINYLKNTPVASGPDTKSGSRLPYQKEELRRRGYTLVASNVYMNESGRFVAQALKKHNVRPDELLVAHDDSDIALGSFKISFGRGAAGHKGAESVIRALKTKNFRRARIGIRPEEQDGGKRKKAEEFVLKRLSPKNRGVLEKVFERLATQISATSP